MGDIFQRIKRIFLAIISFGLIKYENPAVIGPYVIENMKKKLNSLKTSAVPVIANQYRIERMLEAEEKKLSQLDDDARQAVMQNEDDLAGNLLLQKESCQTRVDDLKTQLAAARQNAVEAKSQIELFQEELQTASDRARNAQMRHQLATMRAQVQKFAISPSLDDDMRALERMEEQADQAYAESQAMGDVAAIGDDAKLLQVRKAARNQRAQTALSELKAEMGLSDTEKRFKKVSDEIKPEEQVQTVEAPTASPAPQPQPEEQQQVSGTDQTGS
ncbi:MAG: PspA/IM30 family protein [Armatimonadota bacterium]